MNRLFLVLLATLLPATVFAQRPAVLRSAPTPQRTLGQFAPAWGHKIYDNDDFALSPTDSGECVPVPDAGVVVCGVKSGGVVGVRIDSGRILWEHATRGAIAGRPAVSSLGLFVGSSDGCLYRLDPATGVVLWPAPYCTDAPIRGDVATSGDLVLFAVATNKLYAVRAVDGTFAWEYHRERPDAMSADGNASPVVVGDRVLAGFSDGHLVALDLAEGREAWAVNLGQDLSGSVDVDATPVVVGDRVYASAFAAGPACLRLSDGEILWTARHFAASRVLPIEGDRIVFGTADGEVVALRARDGKPAWTTKLETSAAFAPVAIGRHLMIGGDRGIWALDRATGQPEALLSVPFGVRNRPATLKNRLFFVGGGGTVNAVDWMGR
jgi:outer membrane protein assembly factor BamB